MVRPITVTLASAALMLSAWSLSGCATALDGATENLRIDIAGAGEALCDVTQPGRRYQVYAPSTFRVMKSHEPLRIRCSAAGNRQQLVIVEPVVNDNTAYNVATLGLGAAWDYETGASHEYPKRVLIDFTNTPPTTYPLPDYQTVFINNPELTGMEQFLPGRAAMQGDMGQGIPTLPLRDPNYSGPSDIMMPVQSSSGSISPPVAKSIAPVAAPTVLGTQTTTTTTTPAVAASPGATAATPADGTNTRSSTSMKIFTNKIGNAPTSTTTTITNTNTNK